MIKRKNNEKLFVMLLISAIILSSLAISVHKAVAASIPANISVTVQDFYTDANAENAKVTIVKHPFGEDSINVVGSEGSNSDKAATFSLTTGKYSVSAYHPKFGHGVQVIDVTSDIAGKAIPIKLKLKPAAENWTDLDGVTHEKLMSWPVTIPSNSKTEAAAESQMQLQQYTPILLDEDYFYEYQTKVGEVYSTEGLTNDLDLKFESGIQTKMSVWGGPLSVTGSTQRSSTSVVSLPSVSNGASRTIYNKYDYVYRYWFVYPYVFYETWSDDKIYAGNAHYDTPYPTASYKTLPPDDTLDATDTPPYLTKTIIKKYEDYEGAGWSVGAAITLSSSWNSYSGSVSLGGSYGFTGYTSTEDVYTLTLNGQKVVNVYEWNEAGGDASGTVLTFQNRYWVSNILSYGCLSGNGAASDPTYIIGTANGIPAGDPYAKIYAGNPGDAGYIRAEMNAPASGHIYIYGYSWEGYYNSHLLVYVSPNDADWYLAGEDYVYYQDGLQYIDIGYYSGSFSYISIVGYDDNYYSVKLRLDAVHVVK